MSGESLANLFAYRLLVPTCWFAAEARERLDERDERELGCVVDLRVPRAHHRAHDAHHAGRHELEQLASGVDVAARSGARKVDGRIAKNMALACRGAVGPL